ncbi:MAG: type II secretion system F family protein [Candidatus Saccharimonadales bacterium]
MAKFSYNAMNAQHRPVTGSIEATDRNAVAALLAKQGLQPISIKEEGKKKGSLDIPFLKPKVKSKDLVVFTRQLSTMVSAGVPLLRALTTLKEQSESKALQEVMEVVNKDVQSGTSLADAFAKHPKVFGDIYVNMVRAGEAGGILEDILKRLALQQEKSESIRKKVKGAMTYPTVLIIITIGAFFGLMLFVVPQIGKIVKDLGGPDAELPALTQVMLGISEFLQTKWYIFIAVVVLIAFFGTRYIRTPKGKLQFHTVILKVPAIGQIVRKLAVARFARTFSALLGAGVSVLEALKVTGNAVGNLAYKKELEKAAEGVKNGKQLSETLTGNPLFPQIVPQMLAVGEETGQTDTILVKVAEFYEEEVDTMIGSLSSIIEPIMIVVMGGMVGLIAASVLGPISSLSQNIQG